jgi:hypothetical protein
VRPSLPSSGTSRWDAHRPPLPTSTLTVGERLVASRSGSCVNLSNLREMQPTKFELIINLTLARHRRSRTIRKTPVASDQDSRVVSALRTSPESMMH